VRARPRAAQPPAGDPNRGGRLRPLSRRRRIRDRQAGAARRRERLGGRRRAWLADIAAFYAALRTFGLHLGVDKLILAYATGYAATRRSLPLGGAGVTEVLMSYPLYWVRQPLAPALAAVVAYRAFNFLLAAMPALVARRHVEPLLDAADEMRRRAA
jgi:hypothetical protein